MFVDPFAFNIRFETIESLTANRRVDILVNFQTLGIRRSTTVPTPKITDLFGDGGRWKQIYDSSDDPTQALLAHYGDQLATLGYLSDPTTAVPIRDNRGIVQYYLFFASKDSLGIKFWKETKKKAGWGRFF